MRAEPPAAFSLSSSGSTCPTLDIEAARRFLTALDPGASAFTFQLLPGLGVGRSITRHCTLDELWPLVEQYNTPGCGMGVFVTINQTDLQGRKSSNVVRARAIFVDADSPEQVSCCSDFINVTGATPSAIVQTSPSKAHFYWFVDDLDLQVYLSLQAALIERLGTDPSPRDLPRLMRLPGTLHLKDQQVPHLVKLVNLGPRWTLEPLLQRMGSAGITLEVSSTRSASGILTGVGALLQPAPASAPGANDDLTAGITPDCWFEKLSPADKDACLRDLLTACSDVASSATREPWISLLMAAHASGAPSAEPIALDWCRGGGPAFCGEEQFAQQWQSFDRHGVAHRITIGTLIHYAVLHGFETAPWRAKAEVSATAHAAKVSASGINGQMPPLNQGLVSIGGTYDEAEALDLLNRRYFLGISEQEAGIYRINDSGTVTHLPDKEFKLLIDNVRVRTDKGKIVPAEKFWRRHQHRNERRFVFKTQGSAGPGEHNLWCGFAVEPQKGWNKQRRLLRHILKVICRGEKPKLKYLMRWLAWAVQNPGRAPGTVVVLKSSMEGTGKSTVGSVMCDLFGTHARRIDGLEQFLGQFNAELETTCFLLAEEVLWAGDHKSSDKLKSRVTSETIPIEPKYRQRREVPNRLHVIMTTNHEHAVSAGVRDRRFFVLDVSDAHVQDKAWFDPLYRDLDEGGRAQFLWLLLNLRLGDWHPRHMVKTEEAVEQQQMSGDSIAQWSRACIEADAIVGLASGVTSELGQDVPTDRLREAYTGFCRQQTVRPVSPEALGKALTGMFGQRKRLPAKGGSGNRPWGYPVPTGEQWQKALDRRLGIVREP